MKKPTEKEGASHENKVGFLRKVLGYLFIVIGGFGLFMQFINILSGQIKESVVIYLQGFGFMFVASTYLSFIIAYYLILFGRKLIKKNDNKWWFIGGLAFWVFAMFILFLSMPQATLQ